ncbi:MAG: trigger factor [Oscillospiraceae bacterium]
MALKSSKLVETNKYELEIEVSAEAFEEAVQKAYLKAKGKIAVPGFRKGKAPRKIVEKHYGEGVFYEDAVNALYPAAVNEAVEEAALTLVARPDVEITSVEKETGVTMKVTVFTKPEIEVKDYKGIEIQKTVNAVTDEDIDAEGEALRKKGMRIVTVEDRAAAAGDDVVIDFDGYKGGVAFEGGKAEDFTLSLGSGQFIPGFEEQVAGHSTGEEFDIDVTFPAEYGAKELAGQAAVFKIKLKEIKAKEFPALDDEYIKDTTEFESLEEYRADVKKKLEERAEQASERETEGKLFDKVIENMTAEIPEVMFENRVDEMVRELEQRFSQQGITLEMYLQYTGQTEETLRKTYRDQAEKQVSLRLALEKIAEVEGVAVTDEEVEAEYAQLAEQYQMGVDKVKSYVKPDGIKSDLAVGKAADIVKDSAVIK